MLAFRFKKEILKDGSYSYRPVIPVSFVNGARSINAFVLLDTGADITILPWGFAKILQLDLKKEKTKLKGFKEESSVYSSLVDIRLGKGRLLYKFQIPVLVLSEEDSKSENEDAVIGMREFFDRFDIKFKLSSNKIEFTPVNNLERMVYYR